MLTHPATCGRLICATDPDGPRCETPRCVLAKGHGVECMDRGSAKDALIAEMKRELDEAGLGWVMRLAERIYR